MSSHAGEAHFPLDLSIHLTTTVFLPSKVYFEMILHALMYAYPQDPKDNWKEVLGLLTGRVEHENTPKERIFVDRAWPIGHGNAVSVHVKNYGTIITRIIEKKAENTVIVGWYHSHPGFGLFMSKEDYTTQLQYQRMWNKAFALVLDPTLISTKNIGFAIFRLFEPDFKIFGTLPVKIMDKFSKSSIPYLMEHLSGLAKHGGRLVEIDY